MTLYLLLLAILIPILIPSVFIYLSTSWQPSSLPTLRNKRICLLIAHPDDEAMFFAPTVLALTSPETGNHVKILCLSSGNADGLGETRKKELVKSAISLGLRDEEDVFIVDRPDDFPDSMTTTWDKTKISNLLFSAFASSAQSPAPSSPRQQKHAARVTANIDVLVTFDQEGVSSHPNHISLYHGAKAFVQSFVTSSPSPASSSSSSNSPVALYVLTSVNILRKYTGIGDIFTTLTSWKLSASSSIHQPEAAEADKTGTQPYPGALIFLNHLKTEGPMAYGTAWRAMTSAHRSQMVWFRYLWIACSRYMTINDLKLETFPSENR